MGGRSKPLVKGAPFTPWDVPQKICEGGISVKFNVKAWLMYSAIIGFWAGFIVFCILLLNAQLPAPLAILLGVAVALAVGFAIVFGSNLKSNKEAKKAEAAHMAKLKRTLYLSCRISRITSVQDLNSP